MVPRAAVLVSICIVATLFLGYTEILVIRPYGSHELSTLLELKSLAEKQNTEIQELKAQLQGQGFIPSSSAPTSRDNPSSSSVSLLSSTSTSPTPFPQVTRDLNPILDFEDLPHLVGPRDGPLNTDKSLVAICIGKEDKEGVNKLITQYFQPHPDAFTFLLFHYDSTDYSEYEWYNQRNVVAIRVLHKMKYWYIKRFITPNVARSFKNIIILDADVDFEAPFSPVQYLKVANAFNISMSQPAHFQATTSLHLGIRAQAGPQIGRTRTFIECGPAVFFSSAGYQCVWELLQPDLTSGWGLDIIWVDYVISVCGFPQESVVMFDTFVLIHATVSGQGTASSNPGFNGRAIYELEAYKKRFPQLTQSWGSLIKEGVPFGNRSCIDFANPALCT